MPSIEGKGPTGPVAVPPNEASVSRTVGVPKGGTADTSGYNTVQGRRADGKRQLDGKRAPDGGLGFSADSRMAASGWKSEFGTEGFTPTRVSDRGAGRSPGLPGVPREQANADAMASDKPRR